MIVGGMTGSGHLASTAALCDSQRLAVAGGVYAVQNNEWGSSARECLAVGGSGGFTVTKSAKPDGAELMIWLNHNGPVRPFGSQVSTATVGGRPYQVWFGKQAWNTISYSMVTGTTSVRDLDVGQFAADALRRGYIGKSWYLVDVEAGFELWQGGAGLTTDSFAVNVPRDAASASCTIAPSAA